MKATLGYFPREALAAARYDDRFARVDGEWRFERIELRTRFVTTHQRGWAEEPRAEIVPARKNTQ